MFELQRSTGLTSATSSLQGARSRRGFLKLAGMGALAVGGAGVLAACGDDSPAASASKDGSAALVKPTQFRIASAPGDVYFIDSVSASEKNFDKYNLKVGEFLYPASGVQGLQLLTGGSAEAMMIDLTLAMATFANSSPGKRPVIIGVSVPETTYGIVVGKGTWPDASASFEEKMAALKGKKVGVAAVGSGSDLQLRLALETAGLTTDDVTHVGVGQFASGVAQMKAGRVDAYVAVTYATSRLMAASTGGSLYLEFNSSDVPEILSNQNSVAMVVREDYLENNEAAAKAYLAAQWDSKDWIVANRESAADMLNKGSFNGGAQEIAADYIAHYADDVVPKLNPMWKVNQASIELMADVAAKLGMVKPGQISYEVIVPEFARQS